MPLPQRASFYSTDLNVGDTMRAGLKKFEYFAAYFRVNPRVIGPNTARNTRREFEIALQKLAARLHTAMGDGDGTNPGLGYTIAESRHKVVQLGHKPAEVIITGWVETGGGDSEAEVYRSNEHPLENRTVDSNGPRTGGTHDDPSGRRSGIGGNVQHRLDMNAQFISAVQNFKSDVDTMLADDFAAFGRDITLYRLDYQGVSFGDKGIHFPV